MLTILCEAIAIAIGSIALLYFPMLHLQKRIERNVDTEFHLDRISARYGNNTDA